MDTVATTPHPVRVPEPGPVGELRAIRVVWEREVVRFANDRLRLVTSLVQPLLFLFVLGTGLSGLAASNTSGTSFRTFLYPGILAMAVLFTAMFSAASIVWDREFGFLREMLVAPIRRSSIVLGKCLGGATVATAQGLVVVLLAGLVDVPYSVSLIVEVFLLQLLLAYTITAFGVMVAARITQIQSFMAMTQMLIMPLFFLSGALFPAAGLPAWLAVLNRLDPLTYAVDPIRHVVFEHLSLSPSARAMLDPGITWFGWRVPALVSAAVIVALGALMTAIAMIEFEQRD